MKLKITFGILTIILFIMCIMSTGIKNTVIDVADSDYTNSGNVGQIAEGTAVEYSYKASGETIEGYEFLFATYGEELKKGTIYMKVYDGDTTKEIGSGQIQANTIEDNELTPIKTERINLGKRNIRVILYCENFDPDKKVTLWLGKSSENEDGKTLVNGIALDNNLLIFSRKVTKEAPYTWDMILITSICFVIFCSVPIVKKEKQLGGNDELEEKNTQA
ncbi:MAG: hypothetical protein K2I03_06180 [Lachnospiraceae bacterium]|nr:hypothetical protein [Lachnospiraceae bacterium]